MMGVVATEPIPPFERFYLAHRDEVLGYLRRLLGQRAEDAWQETFLRALRAYGRLEHGRHLRAWVFTIATNVAMDELRVKPQAGRERRAGGRAAARRVPRARASDRRACRRPSARRSCCATATTSPTPRSPTRSARPRTLHAPQPRPGPQTEEERMNITPELDAQLPRRRRPRGARRRPLRRRRLADRRAASSPRPTAGSAASAFDPEGQEEELARIFGLRVLRSPLDDVRRELDEYFDGTRHEFDLPLDLRVARVPRAGAARAGACPLRASRRRTARLAREGRPADAPRARSAR